LADAARLHSSSRWTLWRHVWGPQLAAAAAAVWYGTYLWCLWDVETLVLMVPPGGETLALRIFNLLHYGHNTQVDALCVLLVALSAAPLVLYGVGARLWNRIASHEG
jgi:iron(III) transport system permease protein